MVLIELFYLIQLNNIHVLVFVLEVVLEFGLFVLTTCLILIKDYLYCNMIMKFYLNILYINEEKVQSMKYLINLILLMIFLEENLLKTISQILYKLYPKLNINKLY